MIKLLFDRNELLFVGSAKGVGFIFRRWRNFFVWDFSFAEGIPLGQVSDMK